MIHTYICTYNTVPKPKLNTSYVTSIFNYVMYVRMYVQVPEKEKGKETGLFAANARPLRDACTYKYTSCI